MSVVQRPQSQDPVCQLADVCVLLVQARPSTDSAFELDLEMRVARSRQTMDFAARQRVRFGSLSCARLTIMEALALMETLPRHASRTPSVPLPLVLCSTHRIHVYETGMVTASMPQGL